MAQLDRDTLQAALLGYEYQKKEIDEKIQQLRAHLGGHESVAQSTPAKGKSKGTRSAEVRAKMAAAQQRRRAAARGEIVEAVPVQPVAAPETPKNKGAKKKRVMSAESRERIAAAQRKRWANAAKAAKKKAA